MVVELAVAGLFLCLEAIVAEGNGPEALGPKKTRGRGTYNHTVKAAEAIDRLRAHYDTDATEAINTAVVRQAWLADQLVAGKELQLHDPETGKTVQVVFL